MERVRTLINKLQEQLEEGVEAGRLLITTQMLLAELQQQSPLARSRVSVVIPGAARIQVPMPAPLPPKGGVEPEVSLFSEGVGYPVLPEAEIKPESQLPKERVELVVPEMVSQPVITPPMPQEVGEAVQLAIPEPMSEAPLAPKVEAEAEPVPVPMFEQKTEDIPMPEKEPEEHAPFMREPASWLADTANVIPTLAHQPRREAMELNETMVAPDESINDRLREKRVEVATSLQGGPVKDIRKAIGINDRYLFINELFRGDEAMYERSLKTINSYSFLPEAEYWIQRELKIKLGWDEDTATVQHFDQLVKRRFI